jgi:hypothetical protein
MKSQSSKLRRYLAVKLCRDLAVIRAYFRITFIWHALCEFVNATEKVQYGMKPVTVEYAHSVDKKKV